MTPTEAITATLREQGGLTAAETLSRAAKRAPGIGIGEVKRAGGIEHAELWLSPRGCRV